MTRADGPEAASNSTIGTTLTTTARRRHLDAPRLPTEPVLLAKPSMLRSARHAHPGPLLSSERGCDQK